MAVFGESNERVSFFEKAVFVIPFSIISIDLIALLLNKINIPISGVNLIGATIIFCLLCFAFYQIRFKKKEAEPSAKSSASNEITSESENLFNFSTWQTIFILLSIVLAIFIRVAYLTDTIVPASTDLGHHMYWVKTIIDSGKLPAYNMPDFIVGEHIIFAAANLISGVNVTTALPVLILLIANVTGIFVAAILVARLFKNTNTTAVSFFVLGTLYAIAAPQGKYVSGGVIGNILGNMFLPLALYFAFRALKEKSGSHLGLFIFSATGLLYTHHLTSFVLIFISAAVLLIYFSVNIKRLPKIISSWLKILFKPFPVLVLILSILFLAFAYTPSYFNSAAVDQATGAPSKITRVGLSLKQIELNVGSARLILGILGILLLLLTFKPKKLEYSFVIGWTLILFIMTYRPGWLYIDIPSNRVSNYLFLPLSIAAAYCLAQYFHFFRKGATQFFAAVLLYTFLFFTITSGLSDSAEAFKIKNQFQEAVQTFHSGEYLAKTTNASKDIILKDHINIYGDSWYKLFFMKDYKYPLSRGKLTRYSDPTKPRETCTRDMIGKPQSETGRACFAKTGVNYVALNAQLEGMTFETYPEFSKVYASNYISIFKRN